MEHYSRAFPLYSGITYGIAGAVTGWTGSPYFVGATLPQLKAIMPILTTTSTISANLVFADNRDVISGVNLRSGKIYEYKLSLFRNTYTPSGILPEDYNAVVAIGLL